MPSPTIEVRVNGRPIRLPASCSVSAAIARAGISRWRNSVGGEPRGPLCGMGICFECRVSVDGQANVLGCQTPCTGGMEIRTDE